MEEAAPIAGYVATSDGSGLFRAPRALQRIQPSISEQTRFSSSLTPLESPRVD